jgi:hypothetical protein
MNKYSRWYDQIVKNAQTRVIQGYTERHHIQPRSLGGADDKSNLVDLTAREHFVCHWLLTKMTAGEDHYKMLNALRMMRAEKAGQQRYDTAITSRVYESIKQKYSQLQSKRIRGEKNPMWGRTHTEEARRAISEKNTGKRPSEEQVARQVAAQTGRKRALFSEEWKEKMSIKKSGKNNPRFGAIVSDDTKQKMREKALGRIQSEETIKKKADAVRGSKREKKLCPHCNQMIAVNTYPRWHGDQCRARP